MKKSVEEFADYLFNPYDWQIAIFAGPFGLKTAKNVKALLGSEQHASEGARGHSWVFANQPAVVWVYDRTDIPTLVHELLHVVSGILVARGLPHDVMSEEAYCYGQAHLLRHLLIPKSWKKL